jgi:hypothetical protein
MRVPFRSFRVGSEVQLKSARRVKRSSEVNGGGLEWFILGLIFYLILSRMVPIVNGFWLATQKEIVFYRMSFPEGSTSNTHFSR